MYADEWLGFSEAELESMLENAGFVDVEAAVVDKEPETPQFQTLLACGQEEVRSRSESSTLQRRRESLRRSSEPYVKERRRETQAGRPTSSANGDWAARQILLFLSGERWYDRGQSAEEPRQRRRF
jgi:hypothetical protein